MANHLAGLPSWLLILVEPKVHGSKHVRSHASSVSDCDACKPKLLGLKALLGLSWAEGPYCFQIWFHLNLCSRQNYPRSTRKASRRRVSCEASCAMEVKNAAAYVGSSLGNTQHVSQRRQLLIFLGLNIPLCGR